MNSDSHVNDVPSPLCYSRYCFSLQPSRVSPPLAAAFPSWDPAAAQDSDSSSQRFPPVKELAENGHRVGCTALLTNDQRSWPGMKRDVSCHHLFPSPRQQHPGGAGAQRGPLEEQEPLSPLPGAVPAAWGRHCLSRRHFDLLLYMRHWHSFHYTHAAHQAFESG